MIAALAVAATTAVALPASAERGAGQTVDVAHTGINAERVKTVPIARKPGAKPRVAMALPPSEVGPVKPGDSVYAAGEVEVSVTCLEPMPQCVGKIYHFSPYVRARLVLGTSAGATGDASTTPISDWRKLQCSQKLPHRNHHCVLPVEGARQIAGGDALACDRCYVNMVVEAYHGSARRGNVIVVGSDSDDGISQNKGTLNSAVFNPGPRPDVAPVVTRKPSTRRIPVASQSGAGFVKKVVLSRRLDALKQGEQLLIDARIDVKTGHLPYGTLLQSQVVLSEKRGSTRRNGVPAKIASEGGLITAQNGFNCTRGPSAHRSPCTVRKLGAVTIFKDARTKPDRNLGPEVPLFVNLVIQSKAEYGGQRHRAGDVARVARRGSLSVTRYGPEYRR